MLDNGYLYLAATRLSLFRSAEDWALVFELFDYSPRAGSPSLCISTIASKLRDRDPRSNYVSQSAYDAYLSHHPFDENRFFYPLTGLDQDEEECVADHVRDVGLRGRPVRLPAPEEYARHGITLDGARRVRLYEACRYLAAVARDDVLATPVERRVSVPHALEQVLQLEEWHHPDVAENEQPSQLPTFRQLAAVLETGDVGEYTPSEPPNTHWSHWPEGGTL